MLPWLNRGVLSAVIHDLLEYGIEAWYKESNKTQKEQLQRLQNRGLRRILGAVRDTPIAVLRVESAILPLQERCLTSAVLYQSYQSAGGAWYLADHGRGTPPYTGFSGYWSTTSKILHYRLRIAANSPGGTARGCQGSELAATVCKQADLLLKKDEERWPEQYDNDPTGAWFRQMEPKMVCTTSVTQLRLKWMLRVEY